MLVSTVTDDTDDWIGSA